MQVDFMAAHGILPPLQPYFFGGTDTATLTQTIATVAGVTYDVQFWLGIQNATPSAPPIRSARPSANTSLVLGD